MSIINTIKSWFTSKNQAASGPIAAVHKKSRAILSASPRNKRRLTDEQISQIKAVKPGDFLVLRDETGGRDCKALAAAASTHAIKHLGAGQVNVIQTSSHSVLIQRKKV